MVVPSNVFHGLSSELHPKFVTGDPFVKMLFTSKPSGSCIVGFVVGLVLGEVVGNFTGLLDGEDVGLPLGSEGNITPAISISAHRIQFAVDALV